MLMVFIQQILKLDKNAKKYEIILYGYVKEGLGVMDSTASSLCMDNDIPLIVFSITEEGNIKRVVMEKQSEQL